MLMAMNRSLRATADGSGYTYYKFQLPLHLQMAPDLLVVRESEILSSSEQWSMPAREMI